MERNSIFLVLLVFFTKNQIVGGVSNETYYVTPGYNNNRILM